MKQKYRVLVWNWDCKDAPKCILTKIVGSLDAAQKYKEKFPNKEVHYFKVNKDGSPT